MPRRDDKPRNTTLPVSSQTLIPTTTTPTARISRPILLTSHQGLAAAEALAFRNRGAIEAVARALLERQTLRGSEVRRIVEAEGDAEDVARCKREKGMFY